MKWYRNRLTLVEVAPFGQESGQLCQSRKLTARVES
jgi:hypothetical protein